MVRIVIGDPWDLGETIGWQPLHGELRLLVPDEKGGRALVRLSKPLASGGSTFNYVVASPRYEGATMTALHDGVTIVSVFTGVSDDQAASAAPLDTSGWRGGGLTFMGEMVVVANT